jgi:2-keto-4-pentenoate hydratase/2-oxohepta-3-ene-1,7-dioic acid hydratase in catechol pathway
MAMANPKWLKDGDKVEVYIERIGTLRHTIAFE